MSSKKQVDYAKLRAELEILLSELQAGDLDIDKAMKKHDRALEIVSQLETYLESAENKINAVKKDSGTGK